MQNQNQKINITKNITVIVSKQSSGVIQVRAHVDANMQSPVGLNIFVAEIKNGMWNSSDRNLGKRIFNHLWKYKRYEFANCVQQFQQIRAAY